MHDTMTRTNRLLRCTKCFLFSFNIFFLLCGCLLIALGLWIHFDVKALAHLRVMQTTNSGAFIQNVVYILVGLGSFTACVSFFGCCGAWAESSCFLSTYALLLFTTLLTQIIVVILTAVYSKEVGSHISSSLKRQIKLSYNNTSETPANSSDSLTYAWNMMQIKFNCCGSEGPHDYAFSNWFNRTRSTERAFVPRSCCIRDKDDTTEVLDEEQCQVDAIVYPRRLYSKALKTFGCVHALHGWLKDNMHILIGCTSVIVIFEIYGFVCACVLLVIIRKMQHQYPWYEDDG